MSNKPRFITGLILIVLGVAVITLNYTYNLHVDAPNEGRQAEQKVSLQDAR